jgi:type I restriction enzyme, S subunit
VYRPKTAYTDYWRFFHYLLRSAAYKWELQTRSKGVWLSRLQLSDAAFLDMPIVIPPVEDALAIVRYLDHANRRIDRYIRAKRKLIALLNEQKQVIIQQAVTRGLDSNVRFKPSGVEWLGDVPEHWEVVLNQRIFKEEIRPHNGQPETQLSLSQRDGLIATSDMQERSLQTSTFDNWKVTVPGDLVLNRFKAHLGVFFAATLRGIVSFHYGVFAPRRPLITKYFELLYHTRPYRAIYAGRSNGMTVGLQNLSNQNFYNVRSVVPPIDEQERIVSFTEEATAKIDRSIESANREIMLIREYRTRLIADVVTGKIDVREAAQHLPAEDFAPEMLSEVEALSEEDEDTETEELETIAED